ncbi:MAG: DUF1036 domain-containing protein [Pseudomonadota bacterium]
MKLALVVLAFLGGTSAAEAALRICNNHENQRTVAIGYREGPEWISKGWWNIDPGDCTVVLGGALNGRYYHYFENRPGFSGDPASRDLCVILKKFEVNGQDNCVASEHTMVRFKRIDVGGKVPDFTYDLPAPLIEKTMERSLYWYGTAVGSPENWGNAGAWEILVATTLSKTQGCFAMKRFADGTVFRVGFDPWRPDRYLFAFGNDDWASLEYDQEYELKVRIAGRASWTLGSTARNPADGWGVFLVHRSSGTQLIEDFMLGSTITIRYRDREIANLTLAGTTNAVNRVRQCQNGLDQSGGVVSSGNEDDPFAD